MSGMRYLEGAALGKHEVAEADAAAAERQAVDADLPSTSRGGGFRRRRRGIRLRHQALQIDLAAGESIEHHVWVIKGDFLEAHGFAEEREVPDADGETLPGDEWPLARIRGVGRLHGHVLQRHASAEQREVDVADLYLRPQQLRRLGFGDPTEHLGERHPHHQREQYQCPEPPPPGQICAQSSLLIRHRVTWHHCTGPRFHERRARRRSACVGAR